MIIDMVVVLITVSDTVVVSEALVIMVEVAGVVEFMSIISILQAYLC